MVADGSLAALYEEMYSIARQGFPISEQEQWYPFEKVIYTGMIVRDLKKQEDEARKK